MMTAIRGRIAVTWRNYAAVAGRSPGVRVFLWAVGLRLVFAAITANTFDPDEFVVLGLGRAVAHGAIPYRDITFFHPPGMLYLLAAFQPLVGLWWPLSRIVLLLADSLTAVLIWRIGKELYGDRRALVAGLLYGASPIALVSAVRVGPDPIITVLGMAGLFLLLAVRSRKGPILAGVCLGFAVWTKYPAILYLPVYALAAWSRMRHVMVAFIVTVAALFAPFLLEAHALYSQTVLWQLSHRNASDLIHRLSSVGAYWLGLNALGAIGLLRKHNPIWLRAGFCLGALFLLTAQAYYHYFVPVAPFAALLAAPVVTPLFERRMRLLLASAIALSTVWALDVADGVPAVRLFVSASRLTPVQQTAAILDRLTPSTAQILTDQFEYALFADRAVMSNYFWNMSTTVSAKSLEMRISHVAAVVTTKGSGTTFPAGFADFLEDNKYQQFQTGRTTVWIIRGQGAG
jgi:Dolichyl-phosphate-mannose-protein mannosyltransferase